MIKQAVKDLPKDVAQMTFDRLSKKPGFRVWMIEQDGGLWTVVWIEPQPGDLPDSVAAAADALAAGLATVAEGDADATPALPNAVALVDPTATPAAPGLPGLGQLSARYESNGRPDAIGADSVGGPSYGMYQLATRPGTLAKFLAALAAQRPALAAPLQAAGGAAAALAGTDAFQSAWRQLAKAPATAAAFAAAQHAFIAATHYQPLVDQLAQSLGLRADQRSAALRDVLWSVAVQHGPGTVLVNMALAGLDLATADDAALIRAIYAERMRVDQWFARSTAEVRQAVAARFVDERSRALQMLASAQA